MFNFKKYAAKDVIFILNSEIRFYQDLHAEAYLSRRECEKADKSNEVDSAFDESLVKLEALYEFKGRLKEAGYL